MMDEVKAETIVSFCHPVAVPLAKGMMPAAFSVSQAAINSSQLLGSEMPFFWNISVL